MGAEPPRTRNKKTVARGALRVVLFGMAEAGKSSLLGALAQAGESQQLALGGKLTDVSNGLGELQQRLYEGSPSMTVAEVDPYPLVYSPQGSREQSEILVVDCDGRVANELLTRRRELTSGRRHGLGRSVLAADTVILVIDGSASSAQIEAEFSEFARFLKLLEQSRGEQAAVGGLPVFLVLTKCDLLAQPEDGQAAWMDRIEERKQRLGQRFREFLERGGNQSPFGSIHLHLWATAVKRPPLVDVPAQPREPYGVAELFRQAFGHAATFRERRMQAGGRLFVTVLGALGAVAVMVGLAALLILFRPGVPEKTELEREVLRYQEREQNKSVEQQFMLARTRLSDLTGFTRAPHFEQLEPAQQQWVLRRIEELKEYLNFEQALDQIPSLDEVHSEKQLAEIKQQLQELKVPPQYEADFAQTGAGRRRTAYLTDAEAIRKEMDRVIIGFTNASNAGKKVLDERSAPMLPERAKKVLDDAASLPERRTDLGKTIPGSKRITYATLLGIAEVETALQRWQKIRDDLEPSAKLAKPNGGQ